jgi:hypothetical protein
MLSAFYESLFRKIHSTTLSDPKYLGTWFVPRKKQAAVLLGDGTGYLHSATCNAQPRLQQKN